VQKRSIGEWIGFAILVPVVTVFSFLIHELAHYVTGEALGYDSWFNLNYAGFQEEVQPSPLETTAITMAGPIITVFQALAAALLIGSHKQLWLYSFVIVALWQRLTAFGISMVVYPNDEARISMMWGLPIWALPSVVVGCLLLVTIWAAYKARAGLIANLIAYVTTSAAIAAVVFGNQAFPVRLG
jgi:hypothetical protein